MQPNNQNTVSIFSDEGRPARLFLLILAGYFILQIIVRITLTDSLAMDEAEQAMNFQQLRIGYGPQPPLYAWIQWIMFTVFGFNVLALALLKNVLLFATYLCIFCIARPLIGTGAAITASASLLLLPEIAWESQRDLTHTVLLTTICSATLWCYFTMLRKPRTIYYALFGLLIGLGFLSKYNYAVFIAGISGASLLVPEHRKIIWNNKVWLSAIIATICFLPHGLWLLHHLDAASAGTLNKMQQGVTTDWLHNTLRGISSMLFGSIAYLSCLVIVYGLVCGSRFKLACFDISSVTARFFIYFVLVFTTLILILLMSGEISNIKGRWMQPMLFPFPIFFFLIFPGLADTVTFKRILRVVACLAIMILLGIPLRYQLGPFIDNYSRSHFPYHALSDELAHRFPQATAVIASEKLAAGNLYFHRPALPTILLGKETPILHGEVVLVGPGGTQVQQLERFHALYPHAKIVQQGTLSLPYKKSRGEHMTFDYALIKSYSTTEK